MCSWKCRITAASFAGFEDYRWVGRLADPEYSRELALAGNWRSVLSAPMLRERSLRRAFRARCAPRRACRSREINVTWLTGIPSDEG